jgi:DNA polymerase/3'-5' exonuclease PolX
MESDLKDQENLSISSEELKRRLEVGEEPLIVNLCSISSSFRPSTISRELMVILLDGLGIKNLSDLEKAASEGKIHNIPGFSYKKEESILKKIQSLKKEKDRYLLGLIIIYLHLQY